MTTPPRIVDPELSPRLCVFLIGALTCCEIVFYCTLSSELEPLRLFLVVSIANFLSGSLLLAVYRHNQSVANGRWEIQSTEPFRFVLSGAHVTYHYEAKDILAYRYSTNPDESPRLVFFRFSGGHRLLMTGIDETFLRSLVSATGKRDQIVILRSISTTRIGQYLTLVFIWFIASLAPYILMSMYAGIAIAILLLAACTPILLLCVLFLAQAKLYDELPRKLFPSSAWFWMSLFYLLVSFFLLFFELND